MGYLTSNFSILLTNADAKETAFFSYCVAIVLTVSQRRGDQEWSSFLPLELENTSDGTDKVKKLKVSRN